MDRNCLFSERRAYCIFSTFLGSKQRYHWLYKCYWKEKGKKTNISCFDGRHKYFYKYSRKRGYGNSLQSVWKFPQSSPHSVLHITCEKCLDQSIKKILSSSIESSTYKPTVPRWAQRQQFPLPRFSWHILKHRSLSKTVFKPTLPEETLHGWHLFAGDISKPDIVAFVEKANLHYPTIIFITDIHWDNVFRHSCIRRHKIQQKSYPLCKDTFSTNGNLPAHTFRPLSPTDLSKEKP